MSESETKIKPDHALKQPPLYHLIFINDDFTPMDFVIAVLIKHFDYNAETAQNICEQVHHNGQETVAILPYEIAEQKGIEITSEARIQNYPLQIRLLADEN